MTSTGSALVLYVGLAVIVILAIFIGAARLVSAAKRRNARFKWGERGDRADESEAAGRQR